MLNKKKTLNVCFSTKRLGDSIVAFFGGCSVNNEVLSKCEPEQTVCTVELRVSKARTTPSLDVAVQTVKFLLGLNIMSVLSDCKRVDFSDWLSQVPCGNALHLFEGDVQRPIVLNVPLTLNVRKHTYMRMNNSPHIRGSKKCHTIVRIDSVLYHNAQLAFSSPRRNTTRCRVESSFSRSFRPASDLLPTRFRHQQKTAAAAETGRR